MYVDINLYILEPPLTFKGCLLQQRRIKCWYIVVYRLAASLIALNDTRMSIYLNWAIFANRISCIIVIFKHRGNLLSEMKCGQ